ncbi:hypothetical protein M3Y96_00724100 [Aphelenchoides besseyi]|nr:hypothetical protein M3Y96_00724100 [Aphelenchoides besseyi]
MLPTNHSEGSHAKPRFKSVACFRHAGTLFEVKQLGNKRSKTEANSRRAVTIKTTIGNLFGKIKWPRKFVPNEHLLMSEDNCLLREVFSGNFRPSEDARQMCLFLSLLNVPRAIFVSTLRRFNSSVFVHTNLSIGHNTED